MYKINPHHSWLALEARAAAIEHPRHRALVLEVRDHMEHEIKGNLDALMATLTAEPTYHFWGGAQQMVLNGRAAVEGFYQNMIAAGGNQFEVVVEKIVVDDDAVITEGRVKQVSTGSSVLAAGVSQVKGRDVGDTDLFLSNAQLITVWPADPDGKLIGEDIYFGEDAMSTLVPITAADLPPYHRLAGAVADA